MKEDKAAKVYQFHDKVAFSTESTGSVYMSPEFAQTFAAQLLACAGNSLQGTDFPSWSLDTREKTAAPAVKCRTVADLKRATEGTERHFFTRDTMKFFGDRMSNYSLRQPRTVETNMGETVQAYELVRKRPVKNQNQASAWFNAETFQQVFPK